MPEGGTDGAAQESARGDSVERIGKPPEHGARGAARTCVGAAGAVLSSGAVRESERARVLGPSFVQRGEGGGVFLVARHVRLRGDAVWSRGRVIPTHGWRRLWGEGTSGRDELGVGAARSGAGKKNLALLTMGVQLCFRVLLKLNSSGSLLDVFGRWELLVVSCVFLCFCGILELVWEWRTLTNDETSVGMVKKRARH